MLNKDEAELALEIIACHIEENRSFLSEFEDSRPHDLIDNLWVQIQNQSKRNK
tara:strand:- start:3346 stop:3504 length:159 start_codon:yes stop_codon:yes gene_type:complete